MPSTHCQIIILDWRTLMEWLESLVLGVVQGITEFLPVSSDGHLLLTQNLFAWLTGVTKTGKENLFFDVILHLGTTAAILVHYRGVIVQGLRGLLGADDVPAGFRRAEVVRVGLLAAVATSPLVPLALFFKKMIEKTFEGITVAGVGFLITAAVLLLTAWLEPPGWDQGAGGDDLARRPLDRPGPDVRPLAGRQPERTDDRGRAGLGAVANLGRRLQPADRRAGDPRGGRVGDEACRPDQPVPRRVAPAVAATVLAGVVGYFAIIWLTKIVRSGRIWYFSVYLVVLGIVVLTMVAFGPSHLTSVPARLRTRVATGLLDRCELLSRVLRPSFLKLGEPADSIGAAQGTLDPVALRILDELHELFGRSLFDQEASQGYALGVVEAPVLGVGVVHGHQLAQVEDPPGLQRFLQLGRAGLLARRAARPERRFPRRPSAEFAGR